MASLSVNSKSDSVALLRIKSGKNSTYQPHPPFATGEVNTVISCNNYDYIEIACMHQYPLKLTLKSGKVIECKALDTARNEAREECIKVESAGSESKIVLDTIAKLEVTIENPHFNEVSFP